METIPVKYMMTEYGQKVRIIYDRGRFWYVSTLGGKAFTINKNKLKEIVE